MSKAHFFQHGHGDVVGIGDAGDLQRVYDVGERRAAQHHRPLEHHRLMAPRIFAAPGDLSLGGREQAVHQAHEHALPRAVGAEDDGARSGAELEREPLDDPAVRGGLQPEGQDHP